MIEFKRITLNRVYAKDAWGEEHLLDPMSLEALLDTQLQSCQQQLADYLKTLTREDADFELDHILVKYRDLGITTKEAMRQILSLLALQHQAEHPCDNCDTPLVKEGQLQAEIEKARQEGREEVAEWVNKCSFKVMKFSVESDKDDIVIPRNRWQAKLREWGG